MKDILKAIEDLGKYLGLDPAATLILLVLPLGLLYLRFRYNKDALLGSRSLARVRESLEVRDWRSAYFGLLQRRLSWVDGKLGQSAWSADSYEFTLRVAFLYPIASLFIVWVVTGQNTSGITGLLLEQVAPWRRALFLLSICIYAHANYYFAMRPGWRRLAYLAVAFVGAVASTFVGAFAGAVAAAAAGAGAGAFAGAGAAAGAGAVALTLIQVAMSRRGLKGVFFFVFALLMLGLLAITISHPGWFQEHIEIPHFILVFLVLLPITNSAFDWLSLAATRALLKELAVSGDAPMLRVVWNAGLGVILGLLLLAGLAVTATAGVQTANLLSHNNGGPEYLDLAVLFSRLHHNPADPAIWWVYFTLFSTMLPTVVHAGVASASFVFWRLPGSLKRHWLSLLDDNIKDDHQALVGMAWRLTLMEAATVVLMLLAAAALAPLVWLIAMEGMWLLWLCESVAEWLGAPVQI